MPRRRPQDAPGAPLPPPPALPRPRKVTAQEARQRRQAAELLLLQGWPPERLAEALRTTLSLGPKAAAKVAARVLARGHEAALATARADWQRQNLGVLDATLRALMVYPQGHRLEGQPVRDPNDLDVEGIRRLVALRAELVRRERDYDRPWLDPYSLPEGADDPDLCGGEEG